VNVPCHLRPNYRLLFEDTSRPVAATYEHLKSALTYERAAAGPEIFVICVAVARAARESRAIASCIAAGEASAAPQLATSGGYARVSTSRQGRRAGRTLTDYSIRPVDETHSQVDGDASS
jgi:hypothetical protein